MRVPASFACFAVIASLFISPLSAQAVESVILWTGAREPFTGPNLPEGGPLTEIVKRALKVQSLDSEVKFADWNEIPAHLPEGNNLGFPLVKNEERKQKFQYSDVLYPTTSYFYTLESSKTATPSVAAWKGKTLCRQRAFDLENARPFIQKYQWKVERPENSDDCMKMLKEGKVDLMPGIDVIFQLHAKRLFGSNKGFAPIKGLSYKSDLYIILDKENPKARPILDAFNKGLSQIKASGEYRRILERHGLWTTGERAILIEK